MISRGNDFQFLNNVNNNCRFLIFLTKPIPEHRSTKELAFKSQIIGNVK